MNTRTREELNLQKKNLKLLGIKYIDFNDKRVISYVSKSLKNVEACAYVCEGTVNYNDAISASLDSLKVLGEQPFVNVSRFISIIPFLPVVPVRNGYACHIRFSLNEQTLEVDRNSGTVICYKVPINPDLMASLHIGHGHIHALKDTNYDEYIDAEVFGDVIPMLYEFIMADTYPEMKKDILMFRLFSLKEDYKHYENAMYQMKKSKMDKDLYKIIATRSGQYLNSYYYATILFNMYKKNPDVILDMVNKVLNHEMTTRKMLESLGLLHCDNNNIYNIEFDNIRNFVKKV